MWGRGKWGAPGPPGHGAGERNPSTRFAVGQPTGPPPHPGKPPAPCRGGTPLTMAGSRGKRAGSRRARSYSSREMQTAALWRQKLRQGRHEPPARAEPTKRGRHRSHCGPCRGAGSACAAACPTTSFTCPVAPLPPTPHPSRLPPRIPDPSSPPKPSHKPPTLPHSLPTLVLLKHWRHWSRAAGSRHWLCPLHWHCTEQLCPT